MFLLYPVFLCCENMGCAFGIALQSWNKTSVNDDLTKWLRFAQLQGFVTSVSVLYYVFLICYWGQTALTFWSVWLFLQYVYLHTTWVWTFYTELCFVPNLH